MIRRMQFARFKSLKEAALELGSLNLLIGANASGKSNVVRGFRFLSDAIRTDVETAIAPLGGIEGAFFWGKKQPSFRLEMEYFVPDPSAPHSRSDMSYSIEVSEHEGRASVRAEELRIKRERQERGRAKTWMKAKLGKGQAVKDPATLTREPFDTGDPGVLALKAIGFLDAYPRIRSLRQFVESWQFLSVNLEAVRAPRRDKRAVALDSDASNLANVLRTLRDGPAYEAILQDLQVLIDTIGGIETEVDRGRVMLLLKEEPFAEPIDVLSVSDGTLRLLALLTALHLMPEHSLLCVEEPEHGLHPLLFGTLLDVIRQRCPADGTRQVVLTTHSPDLIDAAEPQEVVVIERDAEGQTLLRRPDPHKLRKYIHDFRLGELWRMRQLGGVPR